MNRRIRHGAGRPATQTGEISVLVGLVMIALAGGTLTLAGLTAVLMQGNNNRTWRNLQSELQSDVDSVTDQDVANLRNALRNQMEVLTAGGSFATAALPSAQAESNAAMAATALVDQGPNVINATTGYLTDPESSWNRDGGAGRPAEGTVPTGGLLPEDVPGGTGDVRFMLVWNALVDLDLHVLDPCGFEISFREPYRSCDGFGGELDVDNTRGGWRSTENVVWSSGAPRGTYRVWVHCYSGCDREEADYTLSYTIDGRRVSTSGTLSETGQRSAQVRVVRTLS